MLPMTDEEIKGPELTIEQGDAIARVKRCVFLLNKAIVDAEMFEVATEIEVLRGGRYRWSSRLSSITAIFAKTTHRELPLPPSSMR